MAYACEIQRYYKETNLPCNLTNTKPNQQTEKYLSSSSSMAITISFFCSKIESNTNFGTLNNQKNRDISLSVSQNDIQIGKIVSNGNYDITSICIDSDKKLAPTSKIFNTANFITTIRTFFFFSFFRLLCTICPHNIHIRYITSMVLST